MGRGGIIAIIIVLLGGLAGAGWYLTQQRLPSHVTDTVNIPVLPAPAAAPSVEPPPAAAPPAAPTTAAAPAADAPPAAVPPSEPPPPAAGSAMGAGTLGSSTDPIAPSGTASGGIPFPPECVVPGPSPVIPRGAVASMDDMKIAHSAIQGFVKALEAYQTCLETHIASDAATTAPQIRTAWRTAGNSAVDASHLLANAYAAQWKVFKARQPAATP